MKIHMLIFVWLCLQINVLNAQTPLSKCPKNYMLVFGMDVSKITAIDGNLDFEGLQLKFDWKSIEPQKGLFDFALVDSVLNVAQSHGKKIVFQFQYKTFQGSPPNVPDYLLNDPYYKGGVAYYPDNSSIAKIWLPVVTNRLDTVFKAMGQHFGNHPALKGINLPETATVSTTTDYNVSSYINGIKANIAHARAAFPVSIFIMQYLNWLPGSGSTANLIANLRIIADYTTTFTNTGFGGPDNKIQVNPPFTKLMPIQHEYDGRAVLGNATQWNDYGYINPDTGLTVTAEEILRYSIDTLKDDYIFWLKREPYFTSDVIPTLANYRNNCTSNPLGIRKYTSLIKIYPNPTSDMIFVNLQTEGHYNLIIYNLIGKNLYHKKFTKDISVNLSQFLTKGFYLCEILSNNKPISVKKIILN
ncbi:MAG: T9SS type A sorting domain-containing protein [Flavobacteriaceae bacterium]|nr:T9SS type A sorting domain-containing protein [Flavobacteriaceae bacterium]